MDFFQHQEQARKRTTFLVILYLITIVLLLASVYGLIFFCVMYSGGDPFDPAIVEIMIVVMFGIFLLILGGSLYKIYSLSRGGGRGVAEMLGGRRISSSPYKPVECRLYNVVEEIALAAGTPVPTIYILDNEHGINAFAAGYSPQDAVIGVNRGTVELLTRDELQGVIAHEFSHILNGDMRMNLRLIGVLFGLQVITLIGYYLMRIFSRAGSYTRVHTHNNKGGNGAALLVLFGLGIMLIGYVGIFISSIIKASISRQREFLADASAVQFTRNPSGIAGALKKIGCQEVGSAVKNEHAAEASHLFFGNVCEAFSLGNIFATHPDLKTRIKRIDPTFNGLFPRYVNQINIYNDVKSKKLSNSGVESRIESHDESQRTSPTLSNLIDNIGNINVETLAIAAELLQNIPEDIADDASEPLTAKATFYAILLQADEEVQKKQFEIISMMENQFVVRQTLDIYRKLQKLTDITKIPLAQRIMSTLRQLTQTQYKLFYDVVNRLISADQKLSLFEYTLKAILLRDLDIYFGLAKPLRVRYSTLEAVKESIVVVLSFIAYAGHEDVSEAQKAFSESARQLYDSYYGFRQRKEVKAEISLDKPTNIAENSSDSSLKLCDSIMSRENCTVKLFDGSLHILAETSPMLKKQIYESLLTCIRYDGKITIKEGELIRAVTAMLAIPMPVFKI
jgi:Zn-dependent protease with chaperone function